MLSIYKKKREVVWNSLNIDFRGKGCQHIGERQNGFCGFSSTSGLKQRFSASLMKNQMMNGNM